MPTVTTRPANLDALDEQRFDVLVVGGGINGAVSAAALRARGARVALVDRGDFAGFTSMHSSNLAWGGIKYMETYELGLVRKLCRSRNQLLRAYPSAVREVRFFTTITRGSRHGRWLLFFAALLYWAIGGFFTRRPRLLSNADIRRDEPSIDTRSTVGGLEYSDAHFVDNDAHFVFRFVRDALEGGAVVANYVESQGSRWDGEHWTTQLHDRVTGRALTLRSRVVVNACGPYVEQHNQRSGVTTRHRHVFSKGVHLVVPRVTPHQRVLTFFASDGRLFFVLPMGERSSIGTTDTRVDELPPVVTADDRRFILSNINDRLQLPHPLTEADVIAERCGVRPLVTAAADDRLDDDWTALSRKHVLEVDRERRHLCIFGGKLTDCINVGEEVTEAVAALGVELRPSEGRWFGEADPPVRQQVLERARALGLAEVGGRGASAPPAERLWRRYGPRATAMLEAIANDPRLGEVILPGTALLRVEAVHAASDECIVRLEDYLRRRTMIEQTVPRAELHAMPQLRELCEILFGDDAPARLDQYLRGDPSPALPAPAVATAVGDPRT